MKEKNPIDKLFADNLASIKHPMRPDDWQNALRLIDSEKRRKRRLAGWIFGASFLLALLGAATWVLRPGVPLVGETTEHQKDGTILHSSPTLRSTSTSAPHETTQKPNLPSSGISSSSAGRKIFSTTEKKEQGEPGSPRHRENATSDRSTLPLGHQLSKSAVNPPSEQASPVDDNLPGEGKVRKNAYQNTSATSLGWLALKKLTVSSQHTPATEHPEWMNLATPAKQLGFEPIIGLGLTIGSIFHLGNGGLWEGFQAGFISTYRFSPEWSVQLGIQYAQNHSLATYSQLEFQSEFDFGSITKTLGMHGETRHQLALPLSLHRHFGRWSIFAGAEPSYTLGVQGSIQELTLMPTQGKRSKVQNVVESVSEGWLPTGPYRTWNMRIQSGAKYRINKGLFVQGTLSYQVMDDLKILPDILDQRRPSPLSAGLSIQIMLEQ
ncbi:MAG: porin family protein [Saprospiraceae bacterium]